MKCVHDAVAAALLLFCSSSYFSLFVHSYSFFVGAAAITVDLCKQAHRLQLLAPFHFDGLLLPPLPTPPPSFFSFSFLRDRQNDCLVLLLVFLLLLLFANSKNTTIYASSPAKEKKMNEGKRVSVLQSLSFHLFSTPTPPPPSFTFFHICNAPLIFCFLFLMCWSVCVFMLHMCALETSVERWGMQAAKWEWEPKSGREERDTPAQNLTGSLCWCKYFVLLLPFQLLSTMECCKYSRTSVSPKGLKRSPLKSSFKRKFYCRSASERGSRRGHHFQPL